jgi:hypothetical protein
MLDYSNETIVTWLDHWRVEWVKFFTVESIWLQNIATIATTLVASNLIRAIMSASTITGRAFINIWTLAASN